jgi:hypothetical protein
MPYIYVIPFYFFQRATYHPYIADNILLSVLPLYNDLNSVNKNLQTIEMYNYRIGNPDSELSIILSIKSSIS